LGFTSLEDCCDPLYLWVIREVPDHVLATFRELFRVSSQEEKEVDEAILQHGGAAGLEMADDGVDAVAHASI
jgi:hypothetical protein